MTHTLSVLKRLPLLSEFALVVLSAWIVSGWFMPEYTTQPSNIIDLTTKTPKPLPDLNTMLNVKLFGQLAQKVRINTPKIQKKAIITPPLNIKLLGTVVAGEHSAAIIAIALGGKQSAFFIGDTIQAGVILKTVEANAIIVDHHGNLERISLEQSKQIVSTRTSMPQTNVTSIQTTARPTANRNINKQIDRNHLQRQLQNVPALLSQALAKPHFANGKIDGFTISNIVPSSLYEQVGLKNGDLIMAINGQKITNAAQAMTIYATLKNAASVDLQLMRASGIQNIHVNIH